MSDVVPGSVINTWDEFWALPDGTVVYHVFNVDGSRLTEVSLISRNDDGAASEWTTGEEWHGTRDYPRGVELPCTVLGNVWDTEASR